VTAASSSLFLVCDCGWHFCKMRRCVCVVVKVNGFEDASFSEQDQLGCLRSL